MTSSQYLLEESHFSSCISVVLNTKSPWMRTLTFSTHNSFCRVNRPALGVTSAPAASQRIMDTMLKELPVVLVCFDDILVVGKAKDEHMSNLKAVLQRLTERGVRIKKDKYVFLKSEFDRQYLGHTISMDRVKPSAGFPIPCAQ